MEEDHAEDEERDDSLKILARDDITEIIRSE